MRVQFREESNPSLRTTETVSEAIAPEERIEETPIVPSARRDLGHRSVFFRVLRGGAVVFASFGLFAALTPVITGIPLKDWLQEIDFKKAYSLANIANTKGIAAVHLGDFKRAFAALNELPPDSMERKALRSQIFAAAIAKKDFESAAKAIARYPRAIDHEQEMIVLRNSLVERLGVWESLEFTKNNGFDKIFNEELEDRILNGALGSLDSEIVSRLSTNTGKMSGMSQVTVPVSASQRKLVIEEGKSKFYELMKVIVGQSKARQVAHSQEISRLYKTIGDYSQAMRWAKLISSPLGVYEVESIISDAVYGKAVEAKVLVLEMPISSQRDILLEELAKQQLTKPGGQAESLELKKLIFVPANASLQDKENALSKLRPLATTDIHARQYHDQILRIILENMPDRNRRLARINQIIDPKLRLEIRNYPNNKLP